MRVWEVSAVTLSLSRLILSLSPEEGDQADNKEKEKKQEEEEDDCALDRQKCQAALALLRHAKWFQVRTAGRMTQSFSVAPGGTEKGKKCPPRFSYITESVLLLLKLSTLVPTATFINLGVAEQTFSHALSWQR